MKIIDNSTSIDNSINFLEGTIILVNKPYRWTSFDVVNKIRYRLKNYHGVKKIKVGHNGTLDPLATGLLMIFTGKYTKRIPEEENHDKTYYATVKFGATTDSLDRETEEHSFADITHLNFQKVEDSIKGFLGTQMQEIPIYSATKFKGRSMYHLAREGVPFEPKSKSVEFLDFSDIQYDSPYLNLSIQCGKGTYIRAFARDLGDKLQTRAYLYDLKRTHIANFSLENAIDVEELCSKLESLEYSG